MRAGLKVLFLGASIAGGVNAGPVTKVIQLLDELKVKVQKDLDAETKAMKEYSEFCDDEQSAKAHAIDIASREIDGYNAVIEETTGNIQELSSTIDSAGSEVASKSTELGAATKVREAENADFKAAENELVEAIDTLGRAITIIKREMSFVQSGKKSKTEVANKINAMSDALNKIIVAASYLDSDSRKQLKSFLSTDMDDELTFHQPQATSYSYESKSGGIVATLGDMKDKASKNLNTLRREEMKAGHAYQMIKQSLTDAVAVLNREIDDSQSAKSAAQEKLGKAQGDLATTSAAKKADEEYLTKLTGECTAKATEWSERQKSAAAELAALAKGSEVLSAKFGSFAQVAIKTHRMTANEDDGLRSKAMDVLKKLGRKFNSFAMMQIANAASSDPFGKVRGLIESMIAKLEQQAQEEATHDAFCNEESAKSAKAKETKTSNLEKYGARIDEAKAAIAELKDEISALSGEIAEIQKAGREATALRNKEKSDYSAASKDFKESIEALTQAIVVLKEFYGSETSFIQLSQPEFAESRSDASSMIIGILEDAQTDFTKLLADAEATEAEAGEAFDALMQANKVSLAEKEVGVKAKTSEVKSVEVALTHHKEDYQTTSAELDAVLDYIKKLKPQCESKAMSYEERKARRDAEISGLQEALTILSGEAVPSFVQTKAFLQKRL